MTSEDVACTSSLWNMRSFICFQVACVRDSDYSIEVLLNEKNNGRGGSVRRGGAEMITNG